MNTLRQFGRLFHIYWIFLTYGLDELLFDVPSLKPFRFLRKLNFFRFSHHKKSRAVRLRLALEKLGPIFVKFGQTLSTRRDLLPDDIANELAKLQDNVPPFSSSLAKKKIEKSLGKPVKELFKHFETTPLAAASIAQVHAAELWSGEQVIVKILRPHIEIEIQRDLHLLYFLSKNMTLFSAELRRLRPREVVAEFDQIIHDELDLAREAANASQLKRNFEHSSLLYVPEVYWDYITPEVLVMERINGIPISDIKTLEEKNVNLKRLAENGVEIFFTQVFRDNFFHADMHPGNIFVDASDPQEPRYVGVDFGIMGSLSSQDQRYLAENLLAFFHRDYRRVAQLHISSGWVPSHTRVEQLEAAIRTVCEPIFQKPLNEISFGQMLLKLFHMARRFNMVVQPQLVLLQKTLFNIEGLGRQLYPELDLWATAQPFLEQWMQEQIGLKGILQKIRKNLPYWLEKLPDLPELVYQQLQPKENLDYASLEAKIERLQQKNRYLTYALCLLGIALGWLFYLL